MPESVEELVNKPMVYEDADTGRIVYRASSLLSCQNALLIARTGVDGVAPPEKLQKRFDEGHEQEALILGKLDKDHGFNCYGQQQEVEIPVGPGALIRGHVDALSALDDAIVHTIDEVPVGQNRTVGNMLGEGLLGVIDGKALAPAGYATWRSKFFEAYLYYLWQQGVYLYGLGFDAVIMAVKDKVTGDISVDLFTMDWYKRRLPKATIFQRVMTVEKWAKDPDALFKTPCSPKMWPCPFFQLHPASERAEKPDDAKGDMEHLANLADELHKAKTLAVIAKGDIEDLEGQITKFVSNKKTTTRLTDYTVSTSFGSTSKTLWKDIAAALEITEAEAKDRYTTKTTNKKLSIKVTPKEKK